MRIGEPYRLAIFLRADAGTIVPITVARAPSAEPFTLRLAHWGPAIAWLRQHGVGIDVLADAFGAPPGHIAVLAWRGRRPVSRRALELHRAEDGAEDIVYDPRRVQDLDVVLASIREIYARLGDFAGGMRALDRFRPQLGRARSIPVRRLVARWHEHRAWFAVHSGYTRSAVDLSSAARRLYAALYRETVDPLDLAHLGAATLIGSHAHLYINEPTKSLELLKIYRETAEHRSSGLGSDYYRQLGTAYALDAYLRTGSADPVGDRVLAHAPVVMERSGEARTDNQLTFARRQQFLLSGTVDVDGCFGLVEIARKTFPSSSLEAVIAANYSAAAALTTQVDSARFADGLNLLADTERFATRFPHQASVTFLLQLTPRLRLDQGLRQLWVQHVWYLNPHRRF